MAGSKLEQNLKLKLKDGTEYTWNYPKLIIGNVSVGDQYQMYVEKSEIRDLTNGLVACLQYSPGEKSAGLFKKSDSVKGKNGSGALEKPKPYRGDDLIVDIYREVQNKKKKIEKVQLAKGTGSWLSHLIFDDQVVWKITDDVPQFLPVSDRQRDGMLVLPSDMERRPDIPFMIKKEWNAAEEQKLKIEQIQRDDRKLREEAAKK